MGVRKSPQKQACRPIIMNAFKFMFFLALVAIVWSSPVRNDDHVVDAAVAPHAKSDDIVPEINLVKTGASSSALKGSASASTPTKPTKHTKHTKKAKLCKTGRKVRWYTGVYSSAKPSNVSSEIIKAAEQTCTMHCTMNLDGYKKCGGKIDVHQLTQGSPYAHNAQCNCNSAFKTVAMSFFAMALVLANIKN